MNRDGSQVSGAESKSPIIELQYLTIFKENKELAVFNVALQKAFS